jgi:hypothetical protein
MRTSVYIYLILLAITAAASSTRAQDIEAVAATKQPPATCPGRCIQVRIRNLAPQVQNLRLRIPGGNWQVFRLSSNVGEDFRCKVCSASFEATLLGTENVALLEPGTEYQIVYDAQHRPLLVPRGSQH